MRFITGVVLAAICCGGSAQAQTPADFYRGNTIKLYVSASPGGTYDLVGRLFAKYLAQHMPGAPTVIVMNMPGTVGTGNWLYNVAAKDGSVIGLPIQTVPANQLTTPEQVRFDAVKFNWIGNLEGATGSLFTWHASATKTVQDATARETIMGVPTKGSVAYQLLALSNRVIGTKFKIISGYERNRVVAIERGELEGSATTLQNFSGLAPHWLPNNQVNILALYAEKRLPRFPDAPTMLELTADPIHKQMLEFVMLQAATARAIVAPPGVPADRVEMLRRAFDATARDPGFIGEMERYQLEVEATTGEATQVAVARLIATSPEITKLVLDAIK